MKRLNEQKRRLFEEISRYNQIMGYIKEQQQGEANHTIRELQQLLNSKGINVGRVDGYLGPNTLNGILQALGTTSTTQSQTSFNPQTTTDFTKTENSNPTQTAATNNTTGNNTQTSNTPPPANPPAATNNATGNNTQTSNPTQTVNKAAAGASVAGSVSKVNLKAGQTDWGANPTANPPASPPKEQ